MSDDPSRTALYRNLIERLEKAEAETQQNEARRQAAQSAPYATRGEAMVAAWKAERYFREGHYVALAAMRQAIAATGPSGAAAAKASRDAALAARRGALLNGISPVWRSVFEWLLDLPDTGSRLEAALKDDAKLIALAGLNDFGTRRDPVGPGTSAFRVSGLARRACHAAA